MRRAPRAVRLLEARRFVDDRGWFAESYNRDRLSEIGIDVTFVQDNHSMSRVAGVLRGFHFQRPPHAQTKLVRCVRGRLLDVAVDIRSGSPTYGKWVARELTGDDDFQLFVPVGFAHGFITRSSLIPRSNTKLPMSTRRDPRAA